MSQKINEIRHQFGKDVLGPIFYFACTRLRFYEAAYQNRNATMLFVARAGFRIQLLYDLFLKNIPHSSDVRHEKLFISRVAIAKACLLNDFDFVAPGIIAEFSSYTLKQMLEILLKQDLMDHHSIDNQLVTVENLKMFLSQRRPAVDQVRNYFMTQSNLFKKYIDTLVGGQKTILLVDSGWRGSIQLTLMRNFPQYNWMGLYIGKWDYGRGDPGHFYNVRGLILEQVGNQLHYPQSAIVHYHHIIEDPLEINMSSVESYYLQGEIVKPDVNVVDDCVLPDKNSQDDHFEGIYHYFLEQNKSSSLRKIHRNAYIALKKLEKMICFPKISDIEKIVVRRRSVDFGKKLSVPVLVRQADIPNRQQRINMSLWKQGQICYEMPIKSFFLLRLHRFPKIYHMIAKLKKLLKSYF